MTIKFTKQRPPFKEGDIVDVAPQAADEYIREGSAVDNDEEQS